MTPFIYTIEEPTTDDEGLYECQVTDTDFGAQVKRTFELRIPSKSILSLLHQTTQASPMPSAVFASLLA